MVYRGKPSSACERCAARRTRCDRRNGGCSQCERAGATCVYRDKVDVLFPAHLTHTKATMQKHGGKAIALDSRRTSDRSPQSSGLPFLSSPLSHDMDQFALSYSFHHHIIHPHPTSNTTIHVQDEKILACLKALGMASYSMISRSSKLHDIAFGYYITALQAINTALGSPDTAREDSTLLAIICLSCLESISETWYRSLKGISMHIQGMASLIALRGEQQMQSGAGRLLFAQSCSFIITDCIRAGLPVPDSVHNMLVPFMNSMANKDSLILRWQTLPAYLRIARLKSDIIHRQVTDPKFIIEEAREIDHMFATAYTTVPYSFEYQVVAHRTRYGSNLPAYVYRHHNSLASSAWNGLRNGRMLCHSIIMDVLQRNIDKYGENPNLKSGIDASRGIIRQMEMDILASIPQFLGLSGSDPWDSLDESIEQPFLCMPDNMPAAPMDLLTSVDMVPKSLPVLRISRGVFLLFNLALVGRLAESGSQIRTTVCKVLRIMGRIHGLSLALILATALEENRISGSVVDYQRKADAWVVGEASEELLVGRKYPERY